MKMTLALLAFSICSTNAYATETDREPAGVTAPTVIATPPVTAPDETIKVSGLLDFNYIYNFNGPRPVTPPSGTALAQPAGNNGYRIFDQYHDSFNLAFAEINLTKTQGDVTAFVAFNAGHDVDVLSANDEAGKHISQATITYKPSSVPALSITAGKMMSHLGLEVTKSKDNWNYSRSLLFGWALPFWHEGVAASYVLVPGKVTASAYVYNKTASAYQNNRSKTTGAQISTTPVENLTLVYNFLGGTETDAALADHNKTLHEVNGTYAFSKTLSAGFDVVKGKLTRSPSAERDAEWLAWSVALKHSFGSFALSPRFEVFEDYDGATFGTTESQRLTSETLTLSHDFGGGLEVGLEARQDNSSLKSFSKGNDNAPTDTQLTTGIGLLYNF